MNGWGDIPKGLAAPTGLVIRLCGVRFTFNELRREHLGWNTTQHQEWGLFLLEHLLHNAAPMRGKEHQRCFWALQAEMAQAQVPNQPPIMTLLGSTNADILKVAEKVYWGEYVTVSSVLPHQWQEECIKELCLELAQCMARAGFQGRPGSARPTSQIRGCPHRWAWSPLAKP